MVSNTGFVDDSERPHNFYFFVANIRRGHGVWRLHGHQTQQLHKVVLQHVAELADLVVVRKTTINTHGLGNRDLNMINAGVIPLCIDKSIGKTQGQQVLHCFFAKIMIDSINPFFFEVLSNGLVHFFAAVEVSTDGLFEHDPRILIQTSCGTEVLADALKQTGRRCEVKNRGMGGIQFLVQGLVLVNFSELDAYIMYALTECFPKRLRPALLP